MATISSHDDAGHRAQHTQAALDRFEGINEDTPPPKSDKRKSRAIEEPIHYESPLDKPLPEGVYSNPDFVERFRRRLYGRYEAADRTFGRFAEQQRARQGEEMTALAMPRRHSAGEAQLPPRPPPRARRHSLRRASHRVSMTPSELDASVLVDSRGHAEEILGVRPHPAGSAIEMDDLTAQRRRLQTMTGPVYDGEPLGGWKAWLQAIMATLLVFNCWGFSNAFGLFQAYYEVYYVPQSSPAAIAWIGSTQLALVFGLGVPIGRAVDKGYFRWCFHGGTALMLISVFCSSFCTSWVALWVVQGVLTGIAMGAIFTSGLVALMSWFDERSMGLAMGLPAAGSSLGGIVYILISRHYLLTQGFGPTMRILSGVAAATMIPPTLLFRERRRTRARETPVRHLPSYRLFLDPAFLLATAGLFFSFLGLYFGFIYLVSYGIQVIHLDATAATNLLIFMLAVNLPGRLIPAIISDKCTGPMNTMIPSTILSAIVIGIWAATEDLDQASLTIIACFYGFVSAGIQSLYASTTYSFCLQPAGMSLRIMAIDRIGFKAGFLFSCIGIAVLIGTPIGGALISYRTSRGLSRPYIGAQVFAAVSLLLGGLFLIAARMKKVGLRMRRA